MQSFTLQRDDDDDDDDHDDDHDDDEDDDYTNGSKQDEWNSAAGTMRYVIRCPFKEANTSSAAKCFPVFCSWCQATTCDTSRGPFCANKAVKRMLPDDNSETKKMAFSALRGLFRVRPGGHSSGSLQQ